MDLEYYKNYQWLTHDCHIRFTTAEQISNTNLVETIAESIIQKLPFSLVRIGDGEEAVLAQDTVLSHDWLKRNIGWYGSKSYCGITMPDHETRDRLIQSIKDADVVGIFTHDEFVDRIFSYLNYKPSLHCHAFANVFLCHEKEFVDLIRNNPPLLIGAKAKLFEDFLKQELDVDVKGVYTHITCPEDIPATIEYMTNTPHDWALVSAGVNACLIAPIMAKQYGKVCIDYGQGMDTLLDSKYGGKYYLNKE
jgi:hypothetical protein